MVSKDTLDQAKGLTASANGKLFDAVIRHMTYLERIETEQARRILSFFDRRIIPDYMALLKEKLERLNGQRELKNWNIRELEARIAETIQAFQAGIRAAGEAAQAQLIPLAIAESSWAKIVLNGAIPKPLEVSFRVPSIGVLEQIVKNKPFLNHTFGQWWKGLARGAKTATIDALRTGIGEGKRVEQIAPRVREITGQIRRDAETLVRTAVNHTSSNARFATLAANDDVLAGYQLSVTFDTRTSDICAKIGQENKVYKFDDPGAPIPPLHHNCRTTIRPVVKSLQDLGVAGFPINDLGPGDRASLGGPVSANINYGEWLKLQSLEMKQLKMGKKWGEKYHNGEVSFDEYLQRTGKIPKPTITKDKPGKAAQYSTNEYLKRMEEIEKTTALRVLRESGKAADDVFNKFR